MCYSLKEAGMSARSYKERLRPTAGETHMQQVEVIIDKDHIIPPPMGVFAQFHNL